MSGLVYCFRPKRNKGERTNPNTVFTWISEKKRTALKLSEAIKVLAFEMKVLAL